MSPLEYPTINAVVQIYNYKEKTACVMFGPELVILRPDKQFTQLNLSGGMPKRPLNPPVPPAGTRFLQWQHHQRS